MSGMWKKTLVYLGLAEEEEYDDYVLDEYESEQAREPARQNSVSHLRDGERSPARKEAVVRAMPRTESSRPRVHLVTPRAFNDAQEIGDKFRSGYSVLMNLQSANPDLARRLVDFASGLAYGLAGSMQPVAERVFLITPAGVQVSAEERRRLVEERFFNQL
jgi:cell division inhibitor SepF